MNDALPRAGTAHEGDKVDLPRVCILGYGYVGLTLSTVLAAVGYPIVGIDRDAKVIRGLKANKAHFFEKGLDELLELVSKRERPPVYHTALTEPCADIYIITVGTPVSKSDHSPNLEYVRRVAEEIGPVLQRGNTVILRSTVPVGTTRKIVLPVLEERSGLRAGEDFHLAFCPERTIEGKALKELRELPQIVGGFDAKSTEIATELFRRSTPTIVDVGSIESAEMVKIMDNTYRDVMFGYANQMALLCERLGLDAVNLVHAANQGYNRNSIPVPSPGVGGACLSKDPYILASVSREVGLDPTLFEVCRRINEHMPRHVCNRVADALQAAGKDIAGADVLVLGFAFKGKPETSDLRDSPTLDLVQVLKENGARIRGRDPVVSRAEIEELGVRFVELEEGFDDVDAVIVMTNHSEFEDMPLASLLERARKPTVVLDGWHLFDAREMNEIAGVTYMSIGL